MSTLYSAEQMNQLGYALENAGFTPDEVVALSGYGKLALLKGLLKGHAEIRLLLHIIDCDRDPFVPEGWTVQEHSRSGQLEWNAHDVHLFLTRQQQTGKLDGSSLHRELKNAATLNASVLDYLLQHPYLVPPEWKGKAVCFWGTVYRRPDGVLIVRCMCWNGNRWDWGFYRIDQDFDSSNPAAVVGR